VGNRRVVVKTSPFSSFEASFLGRLSHENIMPLYSTGFVEDRQLHYLCMPYCGRSTLSDLLDVAFEHGCPRSDDAVGIAANRWTYGESWPVEQTRFSLSSFHSKSYVDRILDIAIQIANALQFAHAQHILHGDLKPSNVLLTPSGRILLLDFNLSQDASSPVLYGGTLPYMPPERVRVIAGETAIKQEPTFDVRSDIYSFGALLYHLLVGRPPLVPATDDETCRQAAAFLLNQMADAIPAIRTKNAFVSRRLEAMVLQCLAFNPDERPGTISEVSRALKAERRSLASIGRLARIRPVLFSSAVAVPLVAMTAAAAHIATRPPQYLTNYNEGLRLASIGRHQEAIEHLTESVAAQPNFDTARFELGRALMAREEYDLAINHFSRLARSNNDPHCMAYVGYCFNLKKIPSAAIPWYEKAISAGASSVAVHNNLAASYLTGSTHLSRKEWLARVQDCLRTALEREPASPTIRLNALVHAETRARFDREYDPSQAFPHAQALLASLPHERIIQLRVALWYRAVLQRYENSTATLHQKNPDFTREAHQQFSELIRKIEPQNPGNANKAGNSTRDSTADSSLASLRHHFLEPITVD
jgi:tetratricopeptide (TPR) repeat protein